MSPLISDVHIRQSPSPRGLKTGTITLEIAASMLSFESVTMLKCMSKLCKNHISIVAISITVNAFCKKSFAFSQRSWHTFLAPGIL